MSDLWLCQFVSDERTLLTVLKQRVTDIAFQNIDSDINSLSKCSLYNNFMTVRDVQPYLCKPVLPNMSKFISKFSLSSHKLCIETGRYTDTGINRDDRICHK